MSQHEDLFIKISTDFHNEINALLKEINPLIVNQYHYNQKSIEGKFFLINSILMWMNGSETTISTLTKFRQSLEFYEAKLTNYFEDQQLATCFVYFEPEDLYKTELYFAQIGEFAQTSFWSDGLAHGFFLNMDVVGFPNDCSYKLCAKLKNEEIDVKPHAQPYSDIEIEKGKLMKTTTRSISERYEIEMDFREKNLDCVKKINLSIAKSFREFCIETRKSNEKLLQNFKNATKSINTLIQRLSNKAQTIEEAKIEAYFKVLSAEYINVGFETFSSIFKSVPPETKILWLKSGPRLKYFIDAIGIKLGISTGINKWAAERFEMLNKENLASYLRKQTTATEYVDLLHERLPKDELFKVLK